MKEKSPNAVIESAKDALSTTVLLRGVRASETKNRAMCGEKITKRLSNSFPLSVCNARMGRPNCVRT